MDFLRYFKRFFPRKNSVPTQAAAVPPAPIVTPRKPNPEPPSLGFDHAEQLRRVGGLTVALHKNDMELDLLDWGYLASSNGEVTLTKKGNEWIAASGAWSPHRHPSIDR